MYGLHRVEEPGLRIHSLCAPKLCFASASCAARMGASLTWTVRLARFRSGSRRLSRLTRSGSMMYPKPSPSSSTSAVRRWSASAPGPGHKFEGQCLEQHARTFCDRRDRSSHHHGAGCLLQQALYPRGPGHNFEGQCLEKHTRTFCGWRDGSSHHHFL